MSVPLLHLISYLLADPNLFIDGILADEDDDGEKNSKKQGEEEPIHVSASGVIPTYLND